MTIETSVVACRNCHGAVTQLSDGEWVHEADLMRLCPLYATPADHAVASLTRRERAAVDFIRRHVDEVGFAPTVREVGDAIGLSSTSSVSYVLSRLVQKGAIRHVSGRPRALSIVGDV